MTNGVRLSRGIQRYVMEGNIDKFEKLTIDELEEYSNKFKSLRALIKKIEYPKNTLSELNDIVTKLIDFNNDLIMSIIISNL